MIIRTGNLPPSTINTNQQTSQAVENQANNEVKNEETSATSVDTTYAQNNDQKIENIKNQIANGIYELDLRRTADKMAQEMLFYYRS